MAGNLLRQHAPVVPPPRREPAVNQLTRRRVAVLLALAPAALLLTACEQIKSQSGVQHPRTDRNGQRGAR